MITPLIDTIHGKFQTVATIVNLRKWRYVRLFLRCPKVFMTTTQMKTVLNGLFSNYSVWGKSDNLFIQKAEEIINIGMSILGSSKKTAEEIPWDTDIKSGFIWPSGKYYHDYTIIDFSNNADVKVPWEISRCHDLVALGLAYQQTKDDKYSQKILERIDDWIDKNPWMYSINWTCSMDIAIRAVNWMWAIFLVDESNLVTDAFCQRFSKSIYQHGFFIYNNIENGERYNGNHLISDLVGLVYIGLFLRGNNKAEIWYKYAKGALFNEIRVQFLPSGFHYERSLAYHRLVTEMIGHTISLMERTGECIPLDIQHRVALMQQAIEKVKKSNGHLPNIADNDDGHFLPYIKLPAFDKKDLNHMGIENFPDVGFAIYRSDKYYLFVTNSGISKYPEKGQYNTAHTHCDLLSFELSLGGTDFFVDAGTCNYTGNLEKRDEFRSTKKHNTIQIDGIEQFKYERNRPFQLFNDVCITPLVAVEQDNIAIISGSYSYERNGFKLNHSRQFVNCKTGVTITDTINYPGNHTLSLYFHLDPDVECKKDHRGYVLSASGKNIIIKSDDNLNGHIFSDTISEHYGTEKQSQTLIFNGTFVDELIIETKLIIVN